MACITEIAKNVIYDCSTIGSGGLEIRAWFFNRRNIATITYHGTNLSLVTGLTLAPGKYAYTVTGVKKSLQYKSTKVSSDDMPDKYQHYFKFKAYEFSSEDVENLDALDDVVVVVESKEKDTNNDGTFRVLGIDYGLYPTTDTMRANTNSGSRDIELQSMADQGEKFSKYNIDAADAGVYQDTIDLLDGLLEP